jgi:uncharacterized membrane protein
MWSVGGARSSFFHARLAALFLLFFFWFRDKPKTHYYEQSEHCNDLRTIGHELKHGNLRFIKMMKSVGPVGVALSCSRREYPLTRVISPSDKSTGITTTPLAIQKMYNMWSVGGARSSFFHARLAALFLLFFFWFRDKPKTHAKSDALTERNVAVLFTWH